MIYYWLFILKYYTSSNFILFKKYMKHCNFSVWWWFIYQWWICVFIKHCIENYWNSCNYKDNDVIHYYKIIKDLLTDRFWEKNIATIDILVEWNWNCFEDINLLSKTWEKTKLLLVQVKWWWDSWKKVLKNDDIFNFLNNINKNLNLNKSNKNKVVLLSNKLFSKHINWILSGNDLTIINSLIAIFKAKYNKIDIYSFKIYISECIKVWKTKTKLYYKSPKNEISKEKYDEIFTLIKSFYKIKDRIIKIENFNFDKIKKYLIDFYWSKSAIIDFFYISEQSTNLEWIKHSTNSREFYIYKDKYNDISFLESWEILTIDSEIREGKFIEI